MDDLFPSFKEKAEAASAEVHRFASPAQALAFILETARELGGTAVWAPGPLRGAAGEPAGFTFNVTTESAAGATLGISQADWALADTGTLVLDSTGAAQRLASSLPQVHLAVVGADRILPGLAAVLPHIKPGKAAYTAMITGPSRTADIERVLTIGVHGPERLIIVFVEGMAS